MGAISIPAPRALTVSEERYRRPEAFLNALASAAHGVGLPFTDIRPSSILDAARRSTGLTDWGDERFIAVLEELVRDIEGLPVTPLARAFFRGTSIKAVSNRLRIEAYIKRFPEVLDIPIEKPLFVVGFPRTGTTAIQNLLALHEERRALEFWELTAPVPIHDDPVKDEAKRVREIDRILSVAYLLAPEMGAVHEIRARTPEEDWSLFGNTFAVFNFDLQCGNTAFGDYLCASDMRWAYTEFRRMLQILLHRRPAKTLVLKCPEHLWFLDSLLDVFPDAGIVWTHRDPFGTIASYCSLISLSRRVNFGRFDPRKLGPYVANRFELGISRAMKVREERGDERFLDLPFRTLVKDQRAATRSVCERFGLPYGADMDRQIDAWLSSGRGDERGKHQYDPDRYGLDRGRIHDMFAPYMTKYNVPADAR